MSTRLRFLPAAAALGLAGALTLAVPAAATPQPPVPGSEGPAGPPALMPNGRPAPPPPVSGPQISTGCPAAPYGTSSYAPGAGKTVALTFDDGPGKSTGAILSVLARFGVTATFFNLGENAAAQLPKVTTEARTGFALGNHTWNHPLTPGTASAQAKQMDQATAEQRSQTGFDPCMFRPPGGNYNSTTLSLAQQRHMKVWLWSVDTEDWKAKGSGSDDWVNRIIRLAEQQGRVLQHPVVLMHNQPIGNPATAKALPTIIKFFRDRGYTFVDLLGRTGLGYQVLTANGGVHNFGAPWYGSDNGKLPTGVTAVGLATDPTTGGYWVLRSDGGVSNHNAAWYGSLRGQVPAGQAVTAIAPSRGGYLVLTSTGGVHEFGAPWYGSDNGKMPTGVTAVGLASDPATGGYWILRSDGGVNEFHASWYGSLRGQIPDGQTVTAIAAAPHGGYLILTSGGGVHNFGTPWYGSSSRTLPPHVTAAGLVAAPATGGYWILRSDGGVDSYHAAWYGSLRGGGQTVTAITGE